MFNAKCKMAARLILHFAFVILHFALVFAASAQNDVPLADREENALRTAAERVADSVVQIRTIGGLDAAGSELRTDGPTTGLVISPDGYIVTSTFNFSQEPASIVVTFGSGKQMPAELVATDHSRMLVLLKVQDAADLPVPELAPPDEVRVGQWAVAVGRTFRADRINLSVGIVSAKGRMYGKVLQTDADVSTASYGGPLVDIRGRVLGVIVPIAPQGAGEVAGAEWYDSGIGFAVPLASISEALERMKKGEDQHAGIFGIGLAAKSPHADAAELTTVRPDSPAGVAGLRKGDKIVEVDGRPIKTQTDLRFALGPRYGDESVRVVAMRGDERIERTITLAGKLKAFRHAFLGILPMRPAAQPPAAEGDEAKKDREAKPKPDEPADEKNDDGENPDDDKTEADEVQEEAHDEKKGEGKGVVVRMVYAGSPAAEAGIAAGDHLMRINSADIDDIDGAISEMNNVAPGSEVAIRIRRGEERKDFTLKAARLPTAVPDQLPPAYETIAAQGDAAAKVAAPAAAAEGKARPLKLAEFKESCQVYVPASHEAGRPAGMLIYLHAVQDADVEQIISGWKAICDRDGLILVVPSAAEANRWERTEMEYLRRLTEQVIRQYKPDPRRIVVFGRGSGGAMAWLLGLAGRDIFHGVATSAAPLPRQVRVPESEPARRLAFFCGLAGDESTVAQITQSVQKLADAGYPATTLTHSDSSGKLSEADRDELARWIDTLDRF